MKRVTKNNNWVCKIVLPFHQCCMIETWFSMSNNVLSVLRLQRSNLPLDASFWSNDDHKDPKKLHEATLEFQVPTTFVSREIVGC